MTKDNCHLPFVSKSQKFTTDYFPIYYIIFITLTWRDSDKNEFSKKNILPAKI